MAIQLINIIIKLYNELDKIYSKNYEHKNYEHKNYEHKKYGYTNFIEWNKLYSSS